MVLTTTKSQFWKAQRSLFSASRQRRWTL